MVRLDSVPDSRLASIRKKGQAIWMMPLAALPHHSSEGALERSGAVTTADVEQIHT